MSLEQELLNVLQALDPQSDKTKAEQELDDAAIALSKLLAYPQGLEFVEYIIHDLDLGKKPIYLPTRYLEKEKFHTLIQYNYENTDDETIEVLLSLYHQLWMNGSDTDSVRELLSVLDKLQNSTAVSRKDFVASFSLDDLNRLDSPSVDNDLSSVNVYKMFLADGARRVLKGNHFLEIYVKMSLCKSGAKLIGWPFDNKGHHAYTSIQYQIDGERIELDVHGIAQPLSLILCEAKTSAKITLNDLRRVENTYDKLMRKIENVSNRNFHCQKIFVITGEFDRNIPKSARKNWELIDRPKIYCLVDEFKQLQNEL